MNGHYDVIILGGGFGASLLGMALVQRSRRVAVLERDRHPRVVIGESSTPIANMLLARFAERYGLDEVAPLSHYGRWLRERPEVDRGLKRGFSYFGHMTHERFTPRPEHANELLVEASPDDQHGDTHWWRADVDRYLFEAARARGVDCREDITITDVQHGRPWRITGYGVDDAFTMTADLVIDATGAGGALAKWVQIRECADELHTHSRAVFGHFEDVRTWAEVQRSRGDDTADHPFDCDAAAVHHLLDGGWMWQLRFDSGIVSAGLAIDTRRHGARATVDAERTWSTWLHRYPTLAEMFHHARSHTPLRATGRLQRLCLPAAGEDWALLPNTACFVDPLHSTGIAHTLAGITRLVPLIELPAGPERSARLAAYGATLGREARLIDLFVNGCYRAFNSFELFSAYSMLYFVAATYSEYVVRSGTRAPEDVFLMAHDERFCELVRAVHERVQRIVAEGHSPRDVAMFRDDLFAALRPYSVAGLCDRLKRNMYPFCALAAPPST